MFFFVLFCFLFFVEIALILYNMTYESNWQLNVNKTSITTTVMKFASDFDNIYFD